MTTSGCKVDTVADKYGLDDADERLLRWRNREEAGLRRLETRFNTWLTKRSMIENGMTVLDGEEENYYRLLTDDTILDTTRREAGRELKQAGIDVDELTDDFVSYQTIRKHLNECLDTDTSRDYTPDPSTDRQNIEKLKKRVVNVVEKSINRLRKHGVMQIGEPDVRVTIRVRCGDCGRTHILPSLFDQRRCSCSDVTADEPTADEHESTTADH